MIKVSERVKGGIVTALIRATLSPLLPLTSTLQQSLLLTLYISLTLIPVILSYSKYTSSS